MQNGILARDIIATRKLVVAKQDMPTTWDVLIVIGKPRYVAETSNHTCPYQILGLGCDEMVKYAYGVDALQALEISLQMIQRDLHACFGTAEDVTIQWHDGTGYSLA